MRLAKVLHDHIQQLLVAAKFHIAVLSRDDRDAVKHATREIGELIDESIPYVSGCSQKNSPIGSQILPRGNTRNHLRSIGNFSIQNIVKLENRFCLFSRTENVIAADIYIDIKAS